MKKDQQYRDLVSARAFGGEGREIETLNECKTQEMFGHLRKAIEWVNNKTEGMNKSISNQINRTMMEILLNNMQAAEVYSPPRVAKMASNVGFRAGWSLDLTIQDEDGRYWGFTEPEMRNRAVRKVLQDRPVLFIGRPRCTVYIYIYIYIAH